MIYPVDRSNLLTGLLHSVIQLLAHAGVLTKLDIMDKGTDALAMLRNEVLPLRMGYTAVVNRSQRDIQERKSVTAARENEAAFFKEQSQYHSVLAQCGIPALSKTCGTASRLAAEVNVALYKHSQMLTGAIRVAQL
jgi:hypothetical protein